MPLSSSVILSWQEVSTWGTNCDGNSNSYGIYIGLTASPGTLICWNSAGQLSCPVAFSLTSGATYYWMVRADNGAQSNSSSVWSFTARTDAWYQTQGGDIHANGGNITSIIPPTSLCNPPVCQPYLMLNDAVTNQSGIAVWRTGSLSLGPFATYPTSLAQDSNDWRAMVGSYQGAIYNYSFWQYNLGDEEGIETLSGSQAVPNPGEEKIYEYTSGNLTLTGGAVAVGSKVIILHNGSTLNITGNITVAKGGFLMVVTKGNLEVSSSVSSLQGIYMTDGTVSFGSGATALNFQGTLVGWTNINLSGRDFNDVRNDTQAILKFTFRPDFLISAPDAIKKPLYSWQEINP